MLKIMLFVLQHIVLPGKQSTKAGDGSFFYFDIPVPIRFILTLLENY